MQIPYLVEGEILAVEKRAKVGERNIIRYTVKANLPFNSTQILKHVEATNLFGGISDYSVVRHRATFDTDDVSDFPIEQNDADATQGDRCIIAFISGNLLNPIIVGFKQHPNQVPEITDAVDKDPQAVLQYLGIRVVVSDNGDLQFIHKGAPEVTYDPNSGSTLDSDILGLQQEAAGKSGDNSIGGNGNSAIKPADQTEINLFEFLKGGIFRVRDAEGQSFTIDQSTKKITFTNSYLPSWMSPEAPQAGQYTGADNEYIELDKENGSLTIKSSKITNITSDGDRNDTTSGKFIGIVDSAYSYHMKDNADYKIDGGYNISVEKNYKAEVNGNFSVVSKKKAEIEGSGGAKLSLSQGKVALGSSAAELVDMVSKLLNQLSIETYNGFGAPSNGAALYKTMQLQLDQIKGSL